MRYYPRNGFTIYELLFVVVIVAVVASMTIFRPIHDDIDEASKKISLYLKYTRYLALHDNQYHRYFEENDTIWYKGRWTFKIQHCKKSTGGYYFVVYKDSDHEGYIDKVETALDPLNNKYLYSNSDCVAIVDESPYVLLTKKYGVKKIVANKHCKPYSSSTVSMAMSFDEYGYAHNRLSAKPNEPNKYMLKAPCVLTIYDNKENNATITISDETGAIW